MEYLIRKQEISIEWSGGIMKFSSIMVMTGLLVLGLCVCVQGEDSSSQTELKKIPINKLGSEYCLTGKLGVPLGELTTIEGVVVEGPHKGYEGGYNLRVQRIGGKITQKDIQILIYPNGKDWGVKEYLVNQDYPKLKVGKTYQMEGYETGGYVGTPDKAYERIGVLFQDTGYYFRQMFQVIKAKKTKPIVYTPSMFLDKYGLIEGKAVSKKGQALMVGDGWRVMVFADSAWEKDVEGKQIETWGRYQADSDKKTFKLIDGTWRLVKLEDQFGRSVELRGRARSKNGFWWFNYRGTSIYVENMKDLPGWTGNNHWRPMVIRGRLEKTILPRIDQIGLKRADNRDLKEYFIVREASWEPLPELLSPERSIPY